jgi:hypothetical protein
MLALSSTDLILLSVIGALTLYWLYARLFSTPSSSTNHLTNPSHQQQLPGFNNPNGTRAESNPELLAAGRDFVKKMDLQVSFLHPLEKKKKNKPGS